MLKPRKNQLCKACKKLITKESWCYNGYWWHSQCKDKDSAGRTKKYLDSLEKRRA